MDAGTFIEEEWLRCEFCVWNEGVVSAGEVMLCVACFRQHGERLWRGYIARNPTSESATGDDDLADVPF